MKFSLLCASCVMVLGACAPDVSTVRMGGVFPPREPNCALELRQGILTSEIMSTYDTVGVLHVRGNENEAPNSPRILELIKPQACGLGGETLILNSSANLTANGGISTTSHHSYMVFRKKSADHAPVSQKF